MAAAVSCCLRKDPTGVVYDENRLIESFHQFKLSLKEVHEPFPCVSLHNDIRTVLQVKKPKLYCICQEPHNDEPMIECSTCGKRYHLKCTSVSGSPLEHADKEWAGPCCCSVIRDAFAVRISIATSLLI